MYRALGNRNIIICSLIPSLVVDEIDFEKYKRLRGLYINDPWERLKTIFSRDEKGFMHPEMKIAIQNAKVGGIIGFLFGGTIYSIKTMNDFLRTNDANIYVDKRQAYRALVYQKWLGCLSGGFKWCPPFALFLGSYSLISSCLEVYRNKVGIIDKVVAGFIVGAFYRFMFGYKGMIVSGIFGSILGGFYGVTLWGIYKLVDQDVLVLKYSQYAYSQQKEEKHKLAKSKPESEHSLEILKTGLHVKHTPNPLDVIEDENDEKEKNIKVKETK